MRTIAPAVTVGGASIAAIAFVLLAPLAAHAAEPVSGEPVASVAPVAPVASDAVVGDAAGTESTAAAPAAEASVPVDAPTAAAAVPAAAVEPAAAAVDPSAFCARGTVTAAYLGGGAFVASATEPCTVTLSSWIFDDPTFYPTPTDDVSGYSQSLVTSSTVVLTTTPSPYSIAIPDCGPYQADISGDVVPATLPNGQLGDTFIEGDVDDAGICTDPVVDPIDPPVTPPVTDPAVTPVTVPAATVTPAAVTPTAARLADTGVNDRTVGSLGIAAAALLAVGAGLTFATKRRRATR